MSPAEKMDEVVRRLERAVADPSDSGTIAEVRFALALARELMVQMTRGDE